MAVLDPQATPSAQYKPSPLGYGSPRSSPFRRPESPASPTPVRHTTPTMSPTRSQASYAPPRLSPPPTDNTENRTPRGFGHATTTTTAHMGPPSPLLGSPAHLSPSRPAATRKASASGNALSQLLPAQVRTLRDAFQILDRDSDGVVNREDVADMLGQLGTKLTSQPPGSPQYARQIDQIKLTARFFRAFQASPRRPPTCRSSSRQARRRP